MDIKEIKNLITSSTAVLVLDNGEPSFVILGYGMYKDLASNKAGEKEVKINPVHHGEIHNGTIANGYNQHEKETEILERLNKEILALKTQIEMEERSLNNQGK